MQRIFLNLVFQAAIILLAAAATSAQRPSELALGVVRPDGILVPVALFDGARWINPWPEPSDGRTLDRMIAAVPNYWRERQQQPPSVWHLPGPAPNKPLQLNVLTHVIVDEHCGSQVGLLTDLPRSGDDPHEKRLVTSGALSATLPASLAADAALRGRILDRVFQQEAAAIADWEAHSGLESQIESAGTRKPIRIRHILGHGQPGARTIYYEAERQYARPMSNRPGDEPAVLVAAGWIAERGGQAARYLDGRAVITGPDFKEAITMRPLGILQLDGGTIWVAQEHGYESEAIVLFRVDSTGVHQVLGTLIGGC